MTDSSTMTNHPTPEADGNGGDPTVIDAATLKEWVERHEDVVVLDVRSAAEFTALHIRGSYNVPLPLLAEHTNAVADRVGRRVVLVCHSGVRAEEARRRLHEVGMDSAVVLDGGAQAYAESGGDVVRGPQRWAMDRQVRMAAGALVTTSLLAGALVSPRLRVVAGVVGAGLTYSAATNTCAMGAALARMPWNRSVQDPAAHEAIEQLPVR